MDKLMTTKLPFGLLLIELGAQLQRGRVDMPLRWVLRERNEEAGALANGEGGGQLLEGVEDGRDHRQTVGGVLLPPDHHSRLPCISPPQFPARVPHVYAVAR